MSVTIDRPEVAFDAEAHAYKLEGEGVLGVSTIAKVGGVEDTWGIASAWGFRIGYEGAWELYEEVNAFGALGCPSKDDLRAELKARGLTPWATRDKAAERGSWVHDVLEELGQVGDVPDLDRFNSEVRGLVRAVLRWYLAMRPSFVAMEVQVASRTHRFAGRYDVRCLIDARRLVEHVDPIRRDRFAERVRELAREGKQALCLLDLKTSKDIFPTTHFPQLAGYELAGVEMGFPATDVQLVLNTSPEGEWKVGVSWAEPEDFLAFGEALRAIRRIKALDPEAIRERERDEAILANLPARSRELADLGLPELAGMDARAIGRALGGLRKRGKVEQGERGVWRAV